MDSREEDSATTINNHLIFLSVDQLIASCPWFEVPKREIGI